MQRAYPTAIPLTWGGTMAAVSSTDGDEPDGLSLGARLVRWWHRAQPHDPAERLELLRSVAGQPVILFGPAGRFGARRRTGRLNASRLEAGMVAVEGPLGEGQEWILLHDILYVETADHVRHGPY